MPEYKTPGVYLEEINSLPPSVKEVDTATPVFIGATQKAEKITEGDLYLVPFAISSISEYEQYYGFAKLETGITITLDFTTPAAPSAKAAIKNRVHFLMYYSLRHFFANGGEKCLIISVGDYNKAVEAADLVAGLKKAGETAGITMLLFPDALFLPSSADYYNICSEALQQCAEKNNRIALIDVWRSDEGDYSIDELRSCDLGTARQLSFGAAYYPSLISSYDYAYNESDVIVECSPNTNLNGTLEELRQKHFPAYEAARQSLTGLKVLLPATPAVAGIYTRTDKSRGVWKAPANEIVNDVAGPEILVNDETQNSLNVHVSGRSINVIRFFPGRGVLVWGARTLAGNDNEWRYVSVRRYFNMVEESLKSSTSFVEFEPNNAATWARVRSMIFDFLMQQWKQGALRGNKPEQAFSVKVGLNETMTSLDISEGRMIIEVGLALMRPAEFTILRLIHFETTS